MKLKGILINAGLSGLLFLGSCQSVLEVEPLFQKDGSQIFTTVQDYEFALTGAYALFRRTGYFGSGGQTTSTWALLPDMMADNLVRTGEDLANWQIQVNWTYATDENDLEVAWQEAFTVINQANLVLRNIDRFSAANAKQVNRIKGQALAIRAYAHFDVLRYWGENFDRNSTAAGIPYVEIVDINNKPARLTVAESYNKMFADMELAETLLGDVDVPVNSGTSRAGIDQIAVRAFLARMHLYAKNYEQAESYATQVITARPLASKADFPNIWKDASTAEVIWSVAFNAGEGSPSIGAHIASTNRNRYRPSAAVEALFDQVNDIRYPAYFATRTLSGTARPILNKYFGRATAADNLVNWKVSRTGEMYLIRAEARALQAGKEAGALADLNALRAARINNYMNVNLAGAALVEAIAVERRKELFAEGHRWFDLKRTTRTIDRGAGAECGAGNANCRLTPTSRAWVWPIPQLEINSNPSMAGQQTPGYE
jgi:hypothetical protein